MLPSEKFKEINDRMNEYMVVPPGLFDRLENFNCSIQNQFSSDWREVCEMKRLNEQFVQLKYPKGTVKTIVIQK
jgi:hypothetical protein